jgi:hypothetical protein
MRTYDFTITVEQLVADDKLHPEDREDNPSGEHRVEGIPGRMRDEARDRALDRFHETVPIKDLGHFQVEAVADGETDQGFLRRYECDCIGLDIMRADGRSKALIFQACDNTSEDPDNECIIVRDMGGKKSEPLGEGEEKRVWQSLHEAFADGKAMQDVRRLLCLPTRRD